jgi:hypothetical protein
VLNEAKNEAGSFPQHFDTVPREEKRAEEVSGGWRISATKLANLIIDYLQASRMAGAMAVLEYVGGVTPRLPWSAD